MIRIIENFLEINITETTDQIEYKCYLFFFLQQWFRFKIFVKFFKLQFCV